MVVFIVKLDFTYRMCFWTENGAVLQDNVRLIVAVNDCLNRTSLAGLTLINGTVLQYISGRNEIVSFNIITVIAKMVP